MPTREDWMRKLGPLYGGAVALVHSTPIRWPAEAMGDDARSSGWVVALGLPIGVAAYLVAALAKACGFPIAIAGILGLAALTAASAALIERGLVERLDRDAERTPSIAGILVLVFLTAVRIGAVAVTPPANWLGLFLVTAVVGRWAAVFLQSLGEPILDDDSPRSLVATPAPLWLTAALSGGVLAIAVLALGKAAIVVLALTAAIAFALGLDAQRRDRGLTSPIVACAAAAGELAVLLIATIHS